MHKEIVAVKSYVKRSNLKGAMVNILSMLNMDISLIIWKQATEGLVGIAD